jgi:hypothetical protein
MDERVKKLRTPDECDRFAQNALARGRADLAKEALVRSVQLRAEKYGVGSRAELEALQAIYAYEEVLSKKNGKRTRASRTWQMIERHGILASVERAVARPQETQGYLALVEMGLQDFAFEAVVLKYPDLFSQEAITKSRERLTAWKEPVDSL